MLTIQFRFLFSFLISLLLVQVCYAQEYKLTGKILDATTRQPLIGANVVLMNQYDTTKRVHATTNVEGNFSLQNLRKGSYKLAVSYLGYTRNDQSINLNFRDQSVGSIYLYTKAEQMQGVTIVGSPPQAALKGDTTEFNATAFKVTADANAEDLVKKIPGVTVEEGTVKAQGEDVKKVLVDGKPFFGEDPSIALKNLPAEVIDRVQVFDQQSEQAQLTGFNDGQTSKTMNIVTKKNSRNGQFGKITAAYGNNDRYNLNLNINTFKGSQRLSAIISANNINQQNFMTMDFLGAMGGSSVFGSRDGGSSMSLQGGSFGGGGRQGGGSNRMSGGSAMMSGLSGTQNGISNINSIGINYSNTFSSKLTLSGSYFLNNNRNENIQVSNTEYILSADSSSIDYLNSNTLTKNFNNRLNMRLEWLIDSMNTIIVIPSVNFQSNKSNAGNIETQSLSYLEILYPQTASDYLNNTKTLGYNISNRLIYQHKFRKTGRTISTDLTTTFNEKIPFNSSISDVDYLMSNTTLYTDRISNTMNSGYTISTNIAYSEPIGKKSIIQVNAGNSYTRTYAYKRTSDLDPIASEYFKIDTLSNKYLNYFMTYRVGLTYRLKGAKYLASAGVEFQNANLSGDQTYPKTANTEKQFSNVLPNVQANIRISQQHNIVFNYNTSTNPPSITQLQNVAEYSSNLTRVTIGNPNLEPQYMHNISTRLVYVNREKGSNFFLLFGGSISENSIGNSTIYKDTIQITMPVNRGTGYNFRSMANYGFSLKFIKCNMNFSGGYNFNNTPGFINGRENIAITHTFIQSVVLSSNISTKLDFTISTNGNYNVVTNSVNPENNNNYYSQLSSARLNWTFWKGFSLQNEVSNRLYTGMSSSDYNQNITIVNMGLGKKFLKNQAGEIRFTVNDMFNKNTSISRTITANQIIDQQSMTLSRYFMFSFIYTFRNFKGGAMPQGMPGSGSGYGPPSMPMGPPPGM